MAAAVPKSSGSGSGNAVACDHDFQARFFKSARVCAACSRRVWGPLHGEGRECRLCLVRYHAECFQATMLHGPEEDEEDAEEVGTGGNSKSRGEK
jgi:Phorbol esters/diacylglycerol binding domain (C1 domain)